MADPRDVRIKKLEVTRDIVVTVLKEKATSYAFDDANRQIQDLFTNTWEVVDKAVSEGWSGKTLTDKERLCSLK